jgi:hypothetical protein
MKNTKHFVRHGLHVVHTLDECCVMIGWLDFSSQCLNWIFGNSVSSIAVSVSSKRGSLYRQLHNAPS